MLCQQRLGQVLKPPGLQPGQLVGLAAQRIPKPWRVVRGPVNRDHGDRRLTIAGHQRADEGTVDKLMQSLPVP